MTRQRPPQLQLYRQALVPVSLIPAPWCSCISSPTLKSSYRTLDDTGGCGLLALDIWFEGHGIFIWELMFNFCVSMRESEAFCLIIIHDPGLPLLMSMADFKILASKPVPCN
jgi:hypothetical protein